jgi:hypothetical protein
MSDRARGLASLGSALAAHALVALWPVAGHVPNVAPGGPAPPPADLTLDVVADEVARPESPLATTPAEIEPTPRGGSRAAPAEARWSEVAPSPSSAGIPGPEPEPPPSLATLSDDALGIGAHNPFVGSLPGAPSDPRAEQRPAPDDVTPGIQQSLRDGLRDHDHELGLDMGGALVSVAEDLTRRSPTPVNSRAVFEVAADASGNVTAVRLIDASQGWSEWNEVASSLSEALRSRTLRIPSDVAGLVVTLEITSRWQMPSGRDPTTEWSVLNVPLKKAPSDQKRPMKVGVLKVDPKVVEAPEAPGVSAPTRLPPQQLQIGSILGFDFDVTDLVTRPLRVVHARVLKERTL